MPPIGPGLDGLRKSSAQLDNMNETNSTFQNRMGHRYPLAVSATLLSISIVVAVVGVVGNVLVCFVITKRTNMKTSMNLYLRNLAITDLGVLLVNFPFAAYSMRTTSGWPFGRFLCLYVAPANDIFFGASIWSITVIAIERYKNIISRKIFVKKVESFKRVTLKIVVIWLVSFAVVAVPLYPLYTYKRLNSNVVFCFPKWPPYLNYFMFRAYAVCLAIFWYLLPLGIITITYWKISSQLKQSNTFHKTMHGENSVKSKLLREEEKQRLKQNRKAQRILTPLVVIFAITMLPLNAFRLVGSFVPTFNFRTKHYKLILDLCVLCLVINSAVDPIVYYICSKEFRMGIRALACRRKANSKDVHDTVTGTPKTTIRSTLRSGIRDVEEAIEDTM